MKLPNIPEDQKTPLIEILLRIIEEQAQEIRILKDEIAKLKGQKPRPKIPPSKVADDAKTPKAKSDPAQDLSKTRRGRKKEERIIQPALIPEGYRFKGYENYTVQDLKIESLEILFRLAVYVDANGNRIRGELPTGYQNGHFSAELQTYCICQYYQCHVTEPLLLAQLHEFGIDISSAQLSNILIQNKEAFHAEKEEILEAGIKYSPYLNTDDTGARHDGKNGYCTFLGSPLFSYFQSTESKSRVNFLELLQGDKRQYVISEECLNYIFEKGISDKMLSILEGYEGKVFKDRESWEEFLKKKKINKEVDCRIVTEGALIGGCFSLGIGLDALPIISDAAPQFMLFINGLCWIHEERHYRKLIPISEKEREELEKIRSEIWIFYEALKTYQKNPKEIQKDHLSKEFDRIFSQNCDSEALETLFENTRSRKEGLLLVLKYSFVPLHNNSSERDIREYAKRRKISGSTRSELGRKARDTFTSLKKTCSKHGVSFFLYIKDRLVKEKTIPKLSDLIIKKSRQLKTT
jgi:hypothetical protein